jgi:hypothetical protein
MNFNQHLPSNERLAKNIEYFSSLMNGLSAGAFAKRISFVIHELINDVLSKKFNYPIASEESISLETKLSLAAEHHLVGEDLKTTLLLFEKLSLEIQLFKEIQTSKEIQATILEILQLNDNDLFALILNGMNENGSYQYKNLSDVLQDLGYEKTIQFVFSIIAASLVEILLITV